MRRAFLLSVCAAMALACGACGSSGQTRSTIDYAAHVYIDPRGWAISAPHPWHVMRFHDRRGGISSSGVLISNVRLPRPRIDPQNPVQVNGNVLPDRGIALIVATDADPRISRKPVRPLPLPPQSKWSIGSALSGQPYMESVWFRTHGRLFLADAKIGAKASNADLTALAWMLKSLRAH